MKKSVTVVLSLIVVFGGMASAEVLLYDTFADASRLETNLPQESAVWVSHPDGVTMGVGSLAFNQNAASGSQKMWTYFAPEGAPVTLQVGHQLVTTIEFTPRQTVYDTTSKNFRFGLFYDPTDGQVLEDMNSDDGKGRWGDSTGYAVHFPLSSGPSSSNSSLGKRIADLTSSLLGSGSAYPGLTSGGDAFTVAEGTLYTLTFALDYQAVDQMLVSFSIADATGVLSSNSIVDDGTFGGYDMGVYTQFDHLFFRFSSASGTADVLDFHSIKVEQIVPEPASLAFLGLGAAALLKRRN